MAPILIIKPENALKRAEELANVGQTSSALQHLHECMISKKYRTYTDAHESLMLRLIELCVELRKGKHAREALHAFKNLAQNVNMTALENVITRFVDLAENKVTQAQVKADKIILDQIDDLEELETPESIMLSTVSGHDHKDRTDREVVTPWLKFLWETYRTLLDVLKYSSKLEVLYQRCAHKAFDFCLKYKRKMEMRRLCELLRNHLAGVAKISGQSYAIDLNHSESLQMHLDTRFIQLSVASKLELWQEAFRTVEDIHGLVTMTKTVPNPVMAISFYQQLTKIFWVSENYLFHAAAWNKYYTTCLMFQTDLKNEDRERMASTVLLSALAVPLSSNRQLKPFEMDNEIYKQRNLAKYLNLSTLPTRKSLIDEALDHDILKLASPKVRELYNTLEVGFHPLMITKKIRPIIMELAKDPEFAEYIRPLYNVLLTRLFQQLSQVYKTMKLSHLHDLASFPEPYNYTSLEIEKFLLKKSRSGELNVRINHANNSITFDVDLFTDEKLNISDYEFSNSEKMKKQLMVVSNLLKRADNMIAGKEKSTVVDPKKFYADIEEEREKALARKALIERKKEIVEAVVLKREREEAKERTLRAQQEAEAEKIRLAEESRKREVERLRREREEIEKQQAMKLAEEMKKKNVKIDVEDLENLNRTQLLQMQVEQLENEKKELKTRLDGLSRRNDHIERAYRIEEIPLIKQSYEDQKKSDREAHVKAYQLLVDATKRQHESDLSAKKKLVRMKKEYEEYKSKVMNNHEETYSKIKAEAEKNIEDAKKKRIEQLKEEKKAQLIKEKQEQLQREKEEELRAQKEKEEEEKRAKEAKVYRPPALKNSQSSGGSSTPAFTGGRFSALASQDDDSPKNAGTYRPPMKRDAPEDRPWRNTSRPGTAASSTSDNKKGSEEDKKGGSSGKYVPPWLRK